MANQLSNTGIVTGQTVEALQVSQSVDAFTGAKDYDITISGSLTLTGSLLQTGSVYFKQIAETPATASGDLGAVMIDVDGRLYSGSASVGSQGTTGEKGGDGAQGVSSQGTTGLKGDGGAQGAVGSTGGGGAQGITGEKGAEGTQGAVAAQGTTGEKGNFGVQGITGLQGTNGSNGEKGGAGEDGAAGAQGGAGEKGENGAQGITGIQGLDGIQGTDGTVGSQGAVGAGEKGENGDKGAAGEQGTQGTDGVIGAQGTTGIQGLTGLKGEQGDKGDVGVKGEDGAQGITGLQGITGTQGVDGVQGTDGSQGAVGAGEKGDIGAQGVGGVQGTDGTVGAQGFTGVQGTDGAQGIQGITGTGTQGGEGEKGSEGVGGGSGDVYNPQTRYRMSFSGTHQLYATSTSNMFSTSAWSRSGTQLTITHSAHGLTANDNVVVRNANEDYKTTGVIGTSTNAFTVSCDDVGATSGTDAVYGVLFSATVTENSGDVTAITIPLPGGLNGASQLNSISLYANNQESGLALTLPAGFQEGAGGYTDKEDINIVSLDAKSFSGTGVAGSLTPVATYNLGANFNRIDISAIDNFSPVNLSVRF
tara:strand:- start:37 stop:1803 length:1767 start_codon:yes stop_codon:yes gene_type:complete